MGFPSQAVLVVASLVLGCGGASDVEAVDCSADSLADALADAAPGDTVAIGECEISGAFIVPAGVTLRGQGVDRSRLIGVGLGDVLTLEPGAFVTRVESLEIVSSGWSAISADVPGGGDVELSELALSIASGAGILLRGPGDALLRNIEVTGALGVGTPPPQLGESETLNLGNVAYAGIMVDSTSVVLEMVTISGFAMAGATFSDSSAEWSGGGTSENYQHGVYLQGGSASLVDLEIASTLTLPTNAYSYGLVSFDGATVEATRLRASNNEQYGVVQLAGTSGTYNQLTAEDNGSVALWTQQAARLEIVGMNGIVSGNVMAGVVIRETDIVRITQLEIRDTENQPQIVGMNGIVDVGDGVQIFDSFDDIQIQNTRLSLNGRAGILLETSDADLPSGIFDSVTANSQGDALGAVAQTQTEVLPSSLEWDDGVVREGAAVANDVAHSNRLVSNLEIVGMNGVVAPPPLAPLDLSP